MTGSAEMFEEVGPDAFDEIDPILSTVLDDGTTYSYPLDMDAAARKAMWYAPDKRVFVVRQGGQVVASCYLRANREGPGSHVANAGFIVATEARGRGLARRMGRFIIEEARRNGFRALQFNFVVSTNEPAVRAWQDLGMAIVGTVPAAFRLPTGQYVDAYVMWRSLLD